MAGILYFEKDLFLQKYVEQLAVSSGLEINCYTSYEGLEYLLTSLNPDIIILDEQIKAEGLKSVAKDSEIPVVFTGFSLKEETHFLRKPFCADKLINTVKGILNDA